MSDADPNETSEAGSGEAPSKTSRPLIDRTNPWLAPAISTLGLLLYACAFRQGWIKWNFEDEVFLKPALLIAIVWTATNAAVQIWRTSAIVTTTWWNIGGNLNSPTWGEVLKMTLGEQKDDPISYVPQSDPFLTSAKSVTSYVLLSLLLIQAVTFIVSEPITPRLLTVQPAGDGGLSANLTALLALIAAAISIYFTYRQLQARVKATSRQAWIDKLRERIARFIALANLEIKPGCHVDPHEFDHRRLEMELMLNPSEKDHRLLMYLSLRLAFFRRGEEAFRKIHDVRNIIDAIKRSPGYCAQSWIELLGPIPPAKPKAVFEDKHSDLVGYTLRLAHVVLKREWERVKTTK